MSEKPVCTLEIINPDDILIIGINDKWFRTFTSNTGHFPIKLTIPQEFINDDWNTINGRFTNVALEDAMNTAEVEYKVQLDGRDVVHVMYKTETKPQTFTVEFNDTFSTQARDIDRGESKKKDSSRFDYMMSLGEKQSK